MMALGRLRRVTLKKGQPVTSAGWIKTLYAGTLACVLDVTERGVLDNIFIESALANLIYRMPLPAWLGETGCRN